MNERACVIAVGATVRDDCGGVAGLEPALREFVAHALVVVRVDGEEAAKDQDGVVPGPWSIRWRASAWYARMKGRFSR